MAAAGLRRRKEPKERAASLILLLLPERPRFLQPLLEAEGYLTTYTDAADRALAMCVSNPVQAIVIDQRLLASLDGWSVPQSVKMVKPALPVILLCQGPIATNAPLPTDVDFQVSDTNLQQLTTTLRQILRPQRPKTAQE
jgi:DNA-binding NtrC family response regulator